jgi:Protein of unknown function (DUF3768)
MKIEPDESATGQRIETIRKLNDTFRRTLSGGAVLLAASIAGMPVSQQASIMAAVQAFDAFTADNDPYGEHDFGSLEFGGETIFFKIDYYDLTKAMHSPDEADPEVTERVLTIMLADDY